MKPLTLVLLTAAIASTARSQNVNLNLMPMPARVEAGQGSMTIDASFCATSPDEPRVKAAAKRLTERVSKRTGIPLNPDCHGGASLAITVREPGAAVQKFGESEAYRLQVGAGAARLTADNPLGALRGMETFLQLIEAGPPGWTVPAVMIEDSPRFGWRGLHIDVSRHWMPMEVVLRNLDGMATVKLNVFHWHLSDDQGFRIESKRYPKLHERGSDGDYYTQEQVRRVLAYARERGIRVVPEFDVPAHSSAWLAGYPEFGSAPGPYEIGRKWGIFEPTLDPANEAVYTFLDNFIGEMARLFPDEYFHIGGDEVNGKQWSASARIQAFKKQHHLESNDALQAYFNKRVQAIVKKHGKRMEGWDEILDPGLPKDIVIQSWRGQKSLAEAARMGYEGLLSAPYYLDAMKTAADFYAADPMEKESADLSAEEKKRILGGEVCTWAEFLTPENIDSRIWPRTAAAAERFWSPQEIKDPASMYRRLEAVSAELERAGLKHKANYRLMIERLAGTGPIEPMKTLADVVRPVNLGGRQRGHKYTQQTPLNRLCDAAQPESDVARRFAEMVDESNRADVRRWLIRWRDNDAALKPRLEHNQLTQELVPLSAELSAVAAIGLRALDSIESGKRLDPAWVTEQRAVLENAKKPQAEVLLMVAPGIAKLLDAAAGR